MPSLRELQTGFVGAVLCPQHAEQFARHLRRRQLRNEQRIQLYRNNLYATLTGALEAVYPVVRKLVGEQCFQGVARLYAADNQSGSGDIHAYGHRFACFLSTVDALRGLPYLPDVAHLEWIYHSLFHSALKPALLPAALQQVPVSRYDVLRLGLQPASRLFASDYPVLRIWQVNQDDWQGDSAIRLDDGGVRLLALRDRSDVAFIPLGAGEYTLLQALHGDMSLADATALALDCEPELDLAGVLSRHFRLGSFAGFSHDGIVHQA